MSTRKKTYGVLVLVLVLAASAYLWTHYMATDGAVSANSDESGKPVEEKESAVPVELAVARRGDISATVGSTSNLRAQREVDVSVQTEGVVEEILVEEGDFVQQGQLLCRLDDNQYQIRLRTARQKLAQARLQLEKGGIRQEKAKVQVANSREEYERYRALYDERLVSEREVAQAKYRLDELEHDLRVSSSESRELTHKVEELEAEIEQSELEIARTRIEAPFSGYITDRKVNLGQTVRSMDGLFRLGDFAPLQAEVFLSEREAVTVRPGQKATILSGVNGGQGVDGRVARISPVVDQSTGTVKVTVELDRGNAVLKPGAFVRVEIRTDTRPDAVLIPKRAVVEEDGLKYVFVARDGVVSRTQVTLGYQSQSEVEVVEGLSEGDSVVVAGQGGLKDGDKVRLVERVIA